MLKVKESKFNHVVEHHVFKLENGDEVLIHERELEEDVSHESIQEKLYYPVFDETKEIIGFELKK